MFKQVAPGVLRITHGISNCYLVERAGRLVLIDAGVPRDWGQLLAAIRSIGRALGDLEAVVLTHAHSDHTGFAERARSSGRAQVWVHRDDEAVARGGPQPANEGKAGPYLRHLEAWRTLFGLLFTGGTKVIPVLEASTFEDGEELPLSPRPRVVHLPGHTPGACALFLEEGGIVFTGDSLVLRNPLTGRTGPQIMPRALNQSSERALASLARLEPLRAGMVLAGHGDPWERGISSAIELARKAGVS